MNTFTEIAQSVTVLTIVAIAVLLLVRLAQRLETRWVSSASGGGPRSHELDEFAHTGSSWR